MLYLLGILIFAFGLILSIGLHEIGHMVPAKKFGVKVTQYMIGFGPTVFSRRKGETEYGLKALPLGGYIRMIGMVPPRKDGKVSRWPRRMGTLIEDFRRTSRDEVRAEDASRQFYLLSVPKRVVIMLGGPFMNLVIYLVLMIVALTAIGIQQPTNRVSAISECLVPASQAATITDCAGQPQSPAAIAGLQSGDRIVAVNGKSTDNWDDTVAVIEKSVGTPVTLRIVRDGKEQTLTVTPEANQKKTYETNGDAKIVTVGMIGISTTVEYQRVGVLQVPGQIASQLADGARRLAALPARIVDLFGTVFEGKARDPEGAIGVVGLGRIGGEVASTDKIDVLDKIQLLLALLASLNLLLFLFNLLPLLPLDGGHIAGALWEGARRQIAKLRSRPDPGHVDTAQMLPVMYGVALILIFVSLLTLYADIVSPVKLF